MRNSRLQKYLAAKKKSASEGMKKSDIRNNPDKHIDQDFNGFPGGSAGEDIINPKTTSQRKTAAVHKKDGEKIQSEKKKRSGKIDADDDSVGSGGAFEATENPAKE